MTEDQDKTREQLIEELQKHRDSDQQFSVAFRQSPCLMGITRVEDGLIHEVNDAFIRVSGYARDELVGRTTVDVGIWEKPERRARFIDKVREPGESPDQEVRITTKSGSIRTVLLAGSYNLTLAGEHHLITIGTDITARKQIEAERETLLSELEAALDRVKTLSGILPICSHCKKIRDGVDEWHSLETYIRDRSEANFSHTICPGCATAFYPKLSD